MEGFGQRVNKQVGGRIDGGENDRRDVETRKREMAKQDLLFREQHPEDVRDLERMLDEIDFKELKDIFTIYIEKSGISKDLLNFPKREDIFFSDSNDEKEAGMAYVPFTNTLLIYPETLKLGEEKLGLSEAEAKIQFLHNLFHEYAHATAKVVYHVDEQRDSISIIRRTGLNENHTHLILNTDGSVKKQNTNLFLMINEGITERIADEVLYEYIQRKPLSDMSSEDVKTAIKNYITMMVGGTQPYSEARRFTGALTDAIAKSSGIPEEVVWKGLVRQYYRGDSLLDKETANLLDVILGSAFTVMLSESETTRYLEMLRKYHPKLDLSKEDAVRNWLQHLEIGHSVT